MSWTKSKMYAVIKVWIPLFLLFSLFFFVTSLLNNTLIVSVLQLMLGDEKKEVVIKLCEYLNTSISFFLGVVLALQVLTFFRNKNSNQVFNSNGNIYYDYSYATYIIAAKVLGYNQVQLAGVPIGMQYKLVLRGTFSNIIVDVWDNHYVDVVSTKAKEYVRVEKENFNGNHNKKMNLVISDTYRIESSSIDEKYVENPTIRIESCFTDSEIRYLNKPLVNKVRQVLQKEVDETVKELYVFSSANPKNNLDIITSCFRKFGRFQIQKVFVVQFDEEKYKKAKRVI